MSNRLLVHIILVSVTLLIVSFLTNEFVQDNLGEDFIGIAEDADGTDHSFYRIGNIVWLFASLSVPAIMLVSFLWEAIRFIASMFRR